VKTAKAFRENQLLVYRQKGLGYFVQYIDNTHEEQPIGESLNFQESLPFIECSPDEERLSLSQHFWPSYETLKSHRPHYSDSRSGNSIEYRALNNLKTAIRNFNEDLGDLLPFARILVKDLRDYRTLPKYTLRRLTTVEISKKKPETITAFKTELNYLQGHLGKNYLDKLQERLGSVESEIIIAIENRKS
jgi:hypothetical protein